MNEVVVIGLGQMGGVFARAAEGAGCRVTAVKRGQNLLDVAREVPEPRSVVVAGEPTIIRLEGPIALGAALDFRRALKARPRAFWSEQVAAFLEAKEAAWTAENYLREGTLTTFAGIPFDHDDERYDYFQAKRLIKLLRRELLDHPRQIERDCHGMDLFGLG